MQFNMYICTSEKNSVNKVLDSSMFFNGSMLNESSIINPVFLITADSITPYNYMYCQDFQRYYFINDISSVRNGLWRVSCSVDVLMSFREYIYNLSCIIDKQERSYQANEFLNDGSFVADSRLGIEVVPFEQGFLDEGQYLLVTLGPGGEKD